MDNEILKLLREDILEIRKDVKALLCFRAQALGIVIGISAIVSLVSTFIFK